MQLMLSTDEIQAAPAAVKDWFLGRFGIAGSTPAKPEKLKTTKEEPTPKTKTEEIEYEDIVDTDLVDAPPKKGKASKKSEEAPAPPDRAAVMAKAKELIDANNTVGLKKVLASVGVPNVKACPDDKLADLLTALAVAE